MHTIIVGAQYGDEGKGKITDYLDGEHDLVVRFAGGNNAGHTVIVNGKKYAFHNLPSGLSRRIPSAIGAGCVIDPPTIIRELGQFPGEKIPLKIDYRAHIILPHHVVQDTGQEKNAGNNKIGTTGRGIGPCYSDRSLRIGVRFGDFIHEKIFRQKLEEFHENKVMANPSVDEHEALDTGSIFHEYKTYAAQLAQYAGDVSILAHEAQQEGKNILFEGAQGTFLDKDFGTYPYVTSSNTLAANAFIGTGIGPLANCRIIGVTKAYSTRVGSGPFLTELNDATGEKIRHVGKEFGTTTGRPRRCGWLDLPLLRTAIRLNGITELTITKLDVLNGIAPIRVCTEYEYMGQTLHDAPTTINELNACTPVYREFPSFEVDVNAKTFAQLPENVQGFLKFIEKETRIPITIISVGPEREQTIVRKKE
jgi:adenylosuccinate synthase